MIYGMVVTLGFIGFLGFILNQYGILDINFNKTEENNKAYNRCANCQLMRKMMLRHGYYPLDCEKFGKTEIPDYCNFYEPVENKIER